MCRNILIQINRVCILDKNFAQLSSSHRVDVLHKVQKVDLLWLPANHFICEIARIKKSIVIHADWHDLDVILQSFEIIVRVNKHFHRIRGIQWQVKLTASYSFVILEEGRI